MNVDQNNPLKMKICIESKRVHEKIEEEVLNGYKFCITTVK